MVMKINRNTTSEWARGIIIFTGYEELVFSSSFFHSFFGSRSRRLRTKNNIILTQPITVCTQVYL